MNYDFKSRAASTQQGAALLIAIFTLMLISVVALAMILLASTESAIGGNYKSALQSFYNAKAGLEEGRGRIFGGNTNPLTASGFPSGASTLSIGQVWYILNPASGETSNPQIVLQAVSKAPAQILFTRIGPPRLYYSNNSPRNASTKGEFLYLTAMRF